MKHYVNTCITGWRTPLGCLKLQVIFCKRAANYRALLRKMTFEDKASYDSTPLYTLSGGRVQSTLGGLAHDTDNINTECMYAYDD